MTITLIITPSVYFKVHYYHRCVSSEGWISKLEFYVWKLIKMDANFKFIALVFNLKKNKNKCLPFITLKGSVF